MWIVLGVGAFLLGYGWQGGGLKMDSKGNATENRSVSENSFVEIPQVESRGANAVEAVQSPLSFRQSISDVLRRSSGSDRMLDLSDLLRNLDRSNWLVTLDAFVEQTQVHGRRHPMEWSLFVQRAGEVVGKEAMLYFAESGIPNAARISLEGWASVDPEGAFEWLEQEADPDLRENILGAAIRGVGQTKPDLAISLLESLDVADRAKYTGQLFPIFVQSVGMDEASALFDDMAVRAVENGEQDAPHMKALIGQLAQRTLANAYTQGGWDYAIERIEKHVGHPYLETRYVASLASGYAREEPEKAIDWLGGLYESDPDGAPQGLGYFSIVDTWIEKSGYEEVGEWMETNTGHPHYDRMVNRYAQRILLNGGGADEAISWVNRIESPEKRRQIAQSISSAFQNGER